MLSIQECVQEGMLGFYRSASITSVILYDQSNPNTPFTNIYTLVTFQELEVNGLMKVQHISNRPFDLKRKRKVLITSQTVSIDDAVLLYEKEKRDSSWQQPNCPELSIDKLRALPLAFLPIFPSPPLSHGLKNPHRTCQYVLELFSEQKSVCSILNEKERLAIAQWVSDYLPIDLQLLSDRWGNIVFQFPVTIFKLSERGAGDGIHLHFHVAYHPLIVNSPPLLKISSTSTIDQTIVGQGVSRGNAEYYFHNAGCTEGEILTQVRRMDDDLLLYEERAGLMQQMIFDMNMANREKRNVILPLKEGTTPTTYDVEVVSRHQTKAGNSSEPWQTWIRQRNHQESVKSLVQNRFFIQYGSDGQSERDKAISDIRQIIGRYGGNGVYLWDPYCTGEDILQTIYACPFTNVPLKVITSYSKKIRNGINQNSESEKDTVDKINSYADWKESLNDDLRHGGNHLGIQLEVRCQTGQNGWKFHDRFLLFPSSPPMVWSLGSSVNQIGYSHSILQKVEHPQPVIDSFNLLWDKLPTVITIP